MKKLRGFDITIAQLGWVCDCCFTVETSNQFTHEEHVVRSGSRWMVVAILKSYLLARKTAKALAAKPGERSAKGWV